jgi:hypothetical protein
VQGDSLREGYLELVRQAIVDADEEIVTELAKAKSIEAVANGKKFEADVVEEMINKL